MVRRRSKPGQGRLPFKQRGGRREGAGRKPNGEKAMMPRTRRGDVPAKCPVHVTVRLKDELPSLRRRREGRILLRAFKAGKERFGFRLIHFSIQSNHLHLIAEAQSREALSRGMKGLQVRIARALNKAWERKGSVFSDRYHDHVLRSPREVRHALVYVLHNAKKHVRVRLKKDLDEYTSARTFDGWKEKVAEAAGAIQEAVAEAATWLLKTGWRKRGRLSIRERPAPA